MAVRTGPPGPVLHARNTSMEVTDLLNAHVDRFNAAVQSGSFDEMVAHFSEDAVMSFEGAGVGPFYGRDAIAAAYRARPPDDQLVLLEVLENGPDVIEVSYAWAIAPDHRGRHHDRAAPRRRDCSADSSIRVSLEIHPVSADRWDDLLTVFGPNGAYSNCWCTWWILTGKVYGEADPEDRRALLESLVVDDEEPGLLAYRDGTPVGWCAVGPRQRYTRLMSIEIRDLPAGGRCGPDNWVINCFYLPKEHRGQGIATQLLDAAIEYAFANGAASIDGYPLIDTSQGASSLYVGTMSMFERAGFVEIRRVRERPLMRLTR